MKSDGKNKLIKRNYNTKDITECVVNTFYQYWHTCYEVAQTLQGVTEYETCRNIWQYVIDNTRYEEDASGTQFVKTPARLLADGVGDCKSMSVMCASLATCLGIPCSFRFVSFHAGNNVGHVYVITASGINIDPVEYFQKGRDFNEVTPFIYNMDKPIKRGLAVLSGVGTTDIAAIGATTEPYKIWLGGTNILDNTFASNYLYTAIDLQFSLIEIDGDDTTALNECDKLLCALLLYNRAQGNDADLLRAGYILQHLTDCGAFNFAATEDNERAAHLDDITSQALAYYTGAMNFYATGDVLNWWEENIIAYDYRNSEQTISGVREAIGVLTAGNTSQDVNKYLDSIKAAGCYFAYYSLQSDTVTNYSRKMPDLKNKRAIQKSVQKAWVYGFNSMNINESTINAAIKSGQVKDMQTKTVDDWLSINAARIINGEEKIGVLSELAVSILTIISVVASIVSAVLGPILSFILGMKTLEVEEKNNSQAANLLNATSTYEDGSMTETDFSGFTSSSSDSISETISNNKGLFIAAAVAIFALKNKK